jgi:SPP1 gp7 family putative phage head morphogenesis protein
MCGSCEALLARLDPEDVARLRRGAKAAARVESKALAAVNEAFVALENQAVAALMEGREPPDPDFTGMLLEMAYNAMAAGFDTKPRLPAQTARLAAKNAPVKMPSNPAELRKWWDLVRWGKAPARIQVLAKKIKRAYLDTVQSLWVRAGEAFRSGAVWDQTEVRQVLQQATRVGQKRARTIVATETTRYFNKARRSYFDQQPTVTHYLFVAIRDKRTTRWCQTRQGLVYEKGSELLKRETPPVHWNCRSEILPLSPFNPRHRALIQDATLRREARSPEPLPKGWNE